METTKTRYQCRHIFTAGRRCQSPSLRGQDLCYFHQTTRPSSAPPQHTHPEAFTLPMPEDRAAIQLALGQIIARIAAGTLNARRAGLLLYALQIASLNLPKAQESDPGTQVEEITEDPIHGPLAPKAEYKTPNEEEPLDRTGRGRTFVEILLDDWKAGHLTNVAPDIKAVADPQIRVPHPFRSLSANRVGYRLRKQTTGLPHTTTNPQATNPNSASPNPQPSHPLCMMDNKAAPNPFRRRSLSVRSLTRFHKSRTLCEAITYSHVEKGLHERPPGQSQ